MPVPKQFIGETIAHRFDVTSIIQRSDFSVVTRALDRLSGGAEVVLKLALDRDRRTGRARRLVNEYSTIADIRHPGIPTVIDFGTDAAHDVTYLAMERAPGRTLDTFRPMSATEAVPPFVEALRTLAFIHDRGLVHFDVKPTNLIWDSATKRLYLIDFDLAGPAGLSSRGSALYVAPEVIHAGHSADLRADLYSLAAAFIDVLGGSLSTPDEQRSLEVPHAGTSLGEVLARCVRRDPEERFRDARACIKRLIELGADVAPERERMRRARYFSPPWISRAAVIDRTLHDIPEGSARSPGASVVAIKGVAGVGKTRLVDHLVMKWRIAGLTVHVVRPGAVPVTETLRPVRDLLVRLEAAGAPAGSLGELPSSGRDRLGHFDRLAHRVFEAARRKRTVIVFEDLERFDRPSRDFLVHFFRYLTDETGAATETRQVHALTTFRSAELQDDTLKAWFEVESESGGATVLTLEPFANHEATRFVQSIVSGSGMPMPPDSLIARCQGVAATLRDLVRSWVESGGAPDREFPAASGADGRLSRLPITERRLLQLVAASPFGLRSTVVRALDVQDAVKAVERLLDADELTEQAGRLHIADPALATAVLRTSTPGDRASDHRLLARAYAVESGAQDDAARHALLAGDTDAGLALAWDAVPGMQERGEEEEVVRLLTDVIAQARFRPFAVRWASLVLSDVHLARGQLAKARAVVAVLGGDHTTDPALALRLARVSFREGDHESAQRHLNAALHRAAPLEPEDEADLLLELATMLRAVGRGAEARTALDRATPLFASVLPLDEFAQPHAPIDGVRAPRFTWLEHRGPQIANYLFIRGDVERQNGDLSGALRCHLGGLKVVARLRDAVGLGRVTHAVGTVYMAASRPELAERWFMRALRLRREAGDLVGLADTANNLGVLMRRLKRTVEAIEHFTVSLRFRRQLGHAAGEGYSYLNIANVYYERRELDAAIRYYKRALTVAQRLNDARVQAQVLNNLGAVAHLRCQPEDAIRNYREAEALSRMLGDVDAALYQRLNLADAHIQLGLLGEAERLIVTVERAQRVRTSSDMQARIGLLRARAACGRGDLEEAATILARLDSFGDLTEDLIEEIHTDLALCEAERGRTAAVINLTRADGEPSSPETPALRSIALGIASQTLTDDVKRKAVADLAEASRFASRARLPGLSLRVNRVLGIVYRDLGERPRALAAFVEAFESLEQIVAGFSDPTLAESFVASRQVRLLEEEVEAFGNEVARARPETRSTATRQLLRQLKDALFDAERAVGPVYGDARRSGESIRRILDVARALSSTTPLDDLLRQVVDGVIDFSGAERGYIILIDERGRLRIPVARDRAREGISEPEHQISRRLVDEVVRSRRGLRIDNAMADGRLVPAASVANLELRSVMCAPLMRGETLFGILYVDNRSRVAHFTESDLELLDILALQIAIALENARLVREFVRSERLKVIGNLAGGVAHDFNNLLAVIAGRAQYLLERLDDTEVAASVRTIETAARDGGVIVRRLQDFARVRREADFESLSVAAIVADVVEFTRTKWQRATMARGQRIDVTIDVQSGLHVRGSATELREVFVNIMLNAITALQDTGGTIAFSARRVDQRVVITVADDGPGMTEEVRENIFDPYFTTRGAAGTGLGMSIVYGIVARHQGSIRVESRVGEGTRLICELPRAEEVEVVHTHFRRPKAKREGRRILVVDDEPSVRNVLIDLLRSAGFNVSGAGSGTEAIEAFRNTPFDAVLTDLGMVPLNGWDVAQAIKAMDPAVSVVLVTGWGAEIELTAAKSFGVDVLLRKPSDLPNLVPTVDDAIGVTDERRSGGRHGASAHESA